MTSSNRHVAVVGGGLVGLATAYELASAGLSVTLLERGEVGRGCSEGNAGWVTPAISLPVAAPGLRSKGLLWMLRRDSPLYVRPSAVPKLLPWLLQFWSRCSEAAFEPASKALMSFAGDAVDRYEQWVSDLDGIEWRQDGLLMVFRTRAALEDELELLERTGYGPVRRLSPEELEQLEPSLRAERTFGALHIEPEAHVEPLTVSRSLARRCRDLGVEVREHCTVKGLETRDARATGLVCEDAEGVEQRVEADDVVVATGAEAGRLAAACGARIPLQAAKGYSLTVPGPEQTIRHPLYLAEAKIGISPLEGALRLAGTLELSGINTQLDEKRLAAFLRTAEGEIPGVTKGTGPGRKWVGMRPMTPDGLPVIGRLPTAENVWVNTGHQMLGVTLAPRSGELLRRQLLGEPMEDEHVTRAFLPARFAGRAQAR